MKKIPKILGVLTLLFSIFASFGLSLSTEVHAADNATVILHKKMMTVLPDDIQNTGGEMDEFGVYEDYTDGVTFNVFDVTNDFYARRVVGDTVDEAITFVQGLAPTGTAFRTGVTDTDGELDFTLPKKSGGKDAVYLFIESDKAGVTVAANMVLAFPVYLLDDDGEYTDTELDTIHLYPKNVIAADGELQVTKRGTADNALLNGAEFIIQSDLTDRYLSGVANGFFTWSDDIADAKAFLTGRSYGIGTNAFTDVVGANGVLSVNGLLPGDYALIETDAPANAAIIDAENYREFEIVAGQTTATSFTVLNDTILVDKNHVGLEHDYDIGELIDYHAEVNIPVGIGDKLPNDAYKHPALIIRDIPVDGLQFNNDLVLTIDGANFAIDPLWLDLTTDANGFILTIPAAALVDFAGEILELDYHMFLDGSAVPDLGYNNVMEVETDLLEDDDETENVYTGGKRFLKVDANIAEGDNRLLEGAEFVVRDADSDTANYLIIDPVTKKVSWTTDLALATRFTSDSDGLLEVTGLSYGTYWLEETVAPEDYIMIENRIAFTITFFSYADDGELIAPQEVINVRKGRLPSTGGPGIMGVVGVGMALVLTTGGYYVKRRNEE